MAVTEAQAKAKAQILREARDSADGSHNDITKWLTDALQDQKEPGCWCCFYDFVGDGESGTVYFYCDGDLTSAPYSISQNDSTIKVEIDMESCEDVMAVTTYKSEGEPMDYPQMEAAGLFIKGDGIPLCERDIPQSARKKMDAGSFAGKNKSFPISKPEDVKAALSSIGRAGPSNHPPEKLKANILRIAKRKGFPIPKSDQEDAKEAGGKVAAQAMHDKAAKDKDKEAHAAAMKLGADCDGDCPMGAKTESARAREAGARHSKTDQQLIQNIHDHALALGAEPVAPQANDNNVEESATAGAHGFRFRESAHMSTDFQFREAAAISPTVKIISPGRGSSGYYTKEVLQRDGPNVFGRGTLMFINHATDAERNARPEGDWSKLAAVTEGPARWEENGPDGPGLYAPAAVFSKFAEEVREKAPFTGVSINAFGHFAEAKSGLPNPNVKFSESKTAPDGKPGLIGKLTYAESIDLVTKAGRDGKLLLESAESKPQQEQSMAEDQKLTEALAEIRKLKERAAVNDAAGAVAEYFRSVRVPSQAIVERVTARVLAGSIPLTESGDLDRAKVKQFTEAQLNEELEFLKRINPSLVTGMGSPATTQMSEAEREKREKVEKKSLKESNRRFASVMGFGDKDRFKEAQRILQHGRSAFDPNYNARHRGAKVEHELAAMGMED